MFSKPYGTVAFTVFDPDGRETAHVEYELDSYVVQFLQMARAIWGDADVSGVTDTGGTDRTIPPGGDTSVVMDFDAGTGETDTGILIGDNNTGPAIDDTSLGNQLSTNITHGDVSVTSVTTSAPDAFLRMNRSFGNDTGSEIMIREVGAVADYNDNTNTLRHFLAIRDTGSPLVSVASGGSVTAEYTIQITV